jgi:hypothetical protein
MHSAMPQACFMNDTPGLLPNDFVFFVDNIEVFFCHAFAPDSILLSQGAQLQ